MRTFHQRAAACLVALALAASWASHAAAQAIGGNASLSVSTSSAAVTLPANLQSYPSLMIVPAPSSTGEAFYLLGPSTVTALTTSPALPPGGVCINVGPNTTLAAITATGAATLRLTQLTTCAGFSGAGGQAVAQYRSTVNGSVKITTGLTYQLVLPAQSGTVSRQSLTIQNNQTSGSDDCYLIIGTNQVTPGTTTTSTNVTIAGATITAAGASIILTPGGSYQRYFPYVPSDAIYATCTTTSDTLYVDTQ